MNRTPVIYEWETRYSSPSGHPYQLVTRKMRIDDRIRESVIYLDSSQTGCKGSGFLVGYPSDEYEALYFTYAVTNWHVAIRDKCHTITLNNIDGEKERISTEPGNWFHTTEDDLAICRIGHLDPDLHHFVQIPTGVFIDETTITDYAIGVGDWIYLVGRFHVHEGKDRILPTARFGNIAMMPEEPIKIPTSRRKDGGQDCFLVEMRSIGGFSGSPAILRLHTALTERPNWRMLRQALRAKGIEPTPGPWLFGVDVGHLEQTAYLKEGKTGDRILGRIETNSAMTGIIPAWKLLKLLNNPGVKNERADIVKKLIDDRDKPSEEGWIADMLYKCVLGIDQG